MWVGVVWDGGSWYDVLENTRSYLAKVSAFFNMPPKLKAPTVSWGCKFAWSLEMTKTKHL
jgi:hypothetical protein